MDSQVMISFVGGLGQGLFVALLYFGVCNVKRWSGKERVMVVKK